MTGASGRAAYTHGLVTLERYLVDLDDAALQAAIAAFHSATALEPERADSWIALGFALDAAGRPGDALAVLRRAAGLDSDDHEVEVFVMTLLAEGGAEEEALATVRAAARRTGLDLDALEADLTAAGMPVDSDTLIRNGFVHARNFLRSRLEDEIDRARPGAATQRDCSDMREELQRDVDPARVPASFRGLTAWATRLGIGDDYCRRQLTDRLTPAEKAEVRRAVTERAFDIQAWVDTFEPGALPAEAAAFMYLLLGVEEMDPDLST